MTVKKSYVLAVTAVALAAGAIGFGVNAAGADSKPDNGIVVVDPSIPHHELLDDVLAIDAKRSNGDFGFSYVPKARPADLQRMLPGTAGATIVDGYHLGTQPAQVFVEFAAQPTRTCDELSSDPGSGLCLRDMKLAAAADDPKMQNVTIYLSQVGITAPSLADPATDGLRKFWTTTELIPASEAAWFTGLLAEAKAAPKKKLG
jgi:hypothetical protein